MFKTIKERNGFTTQASFDRSKFIVWFNIQFRNYIDKMFDGKCLKNEVLKTDKLKCKKNEIYFSREDNSKN